ncbi:unnamed protein product [Owenia fusiformis]|uniref:Uncharacterized protein n=1 Tax=Owenia fusiformis TaxID=6347 RepID=A0A8J1THH1_OWEFU|nr:unnamed protein product [Owenia fusiformis]
MSFRNSSIEVFEDEEFEDGFSLELKYVIGVTLLFLVIVTVLGNVLTIVSFLRDRQLRTVQNIYIFNLSIVDLAVGVVSLPFYVFYTINNYTWTFGRLWCKIWLVIDFLVCAESSLTIVLISFDRFMLISQGASYTAKQTVRKAVVYIICSWILSFLLYGPAIIFWEYWIGRRTTAEDDCDVEFFNNMEYTLTTAILEFFIPLVLTAYLNLRVYLNIRDRSRKVASAGISSYQTQSEGLKIERSKDKETGSAQTGSGHKQAISQGEGQNDKPHGLRPHNQDIGQEESQHDQPQELRECQCDPAQCQHVQVQSQNVGQDQDTAEGQIQDQLDINISQREGQLHQDEIEGQRPQVSSQHDQCQGQRVEQDDLSMGQREDQNNLDQTDQHCKGQNSGVQRTYHYATTSDNAPTSSRTMSLPQGAIIRNQNKANQIVLRRDRRAARSLSILVVVYFMCWCPYTIMTFIESVTPDTVDKDLYEAANFLLWVNSACNPFLYALMSARFRKNFKQLLCPCKR